MRVQVALQSDVTLARLQEPPFSLVVRRHSRFPNLVLLKYDQLESDMDDPMVCQCRGVILDEADRWRIISRPFDKFWNVHEGRAAAIDWGTARVQEKLDGSLMQLYWYQGQWHVGTSGTPDATGDVGGFGFTFEQLFWRVWREQGCTLPSVHQQHLTFLFELCTPYNRVVVQHPGNSLRLIGVRDRESGNEYAMLPEAAAGRMWRPVQEFPLTTIESVLSTFDTMKPLEQEGYVVVDTQFRRVKVKHPGYVALHHMRDSFSPRAFVEVVRKDEVEEVIAAFPEFGPLLLDIKQRYEALWSEIASTYDSLMVQNLSQKEFALRAVTHPWSGILFSIRKGEYPTVIKALQEVRVDTLCDWLHIGTDVALALSSTQPQSTGGTE